MGLTAGGRFFSKIINLEVGNHINYLLLFPYHVVTAKPLLQSASLMWLQHSLLRTGFSAFGSSVSSSLLAPYLLGIVMLSGLACKPSVPALPPGDPDNGGLVLPEGFEAVVVVDSIGPVRHIDISRDEVIYAKLRRNFPTGSIVALKDTNGNGRADSIATFSVMSTGGGYETGMAIHKDHLYFSSNLLVMRYPLRPGEMTPDTTRVDTLVVDDHAHGNHEHIAKPLAFDDQGRMYIPYGAPSDVCQEHNRMPGSPGLNPCPQLDKHGGVWAFSDSLAFQVQKESRSDDPRFRKTGVRYATGIRSVVAMDWHPVDRELYIVQHGRDFLFRGWPHLYSEWDSAMLPSEEFQRVTHGSDFSWPFCYHNQMLGRRVLAPEYGGDSYKEGFCNEFDQPVIGFPGHYAPNGLRFYDGDQFPEYYRHGAFIAFHGSTIRNPYPQAGYFVAFVPWVNGAFSNEWEVFANGFAGVDPIVSTSNARHRPMGLAVGPDGSLYISDSNIGKIWRIMYTGNRRTFSGQHRAGMVEEKNTASNIRTPDEVLDNLQLGTVRGGAQVYFTYCVACHQRSGEGIANRFPSIIGEPWTSGDIRPLVEVIHKGLDSPAYEVMMPAHTFLSDDDLAALIRYIRSTFGNDETEITSDQVRSVRAVLP